MKIVSPCSSVPSATSSPIPAVGPTAQVTAFSGSAPNSATLRLLSKAIPSPLGFTLLTVLSAPDPSASVLPSPPVLSSDDDAELCPLLFAVAVGIAVSRGFHFVPIGVAIMILAGIAVAVVMLG